MADIYVLVGDASQLCDYPEGYGVLDMIVQRGLDDCFGIVVVFIEDKVFCLGAVYQEAVVVFGIYARRASGGKYQRFFKRPGGRHQGAALHGKVPEACSAGGKKIDVYGRMGFDIPGPFQGADMAVADNAYFHTNLPEGSEDFFITDVVLVDVGFCGTFGTGGRDAVFLFQGSKEMFHDEVDPGAGDVTLVWLKEEAFKDRAVDDFVGGEVVHVVLFRGQLSRHGAEDGLGFHGGHQDISVGPGGGKGNR